MSFMICGTAVIDIKTKKTGIKYKEDIKAERFYTSYE